ncbi:MAG: NADH:ubiquinone oxidoreductase 21kD subunit [Candelina submexicana]|nr:MAG: NADH:ubiquinone oxidoreductase 21kD subunit [Candelina submexicana]
MSLSRHTLITRSLAALPATRLSSIQVRYNSQLTDRSVQPSPKSQSTDAPAATPGDSAMISRQSPSEASVSHNQPDYGAPVDHGTSTFSPVPKRVLDGSESGETLSAAVMSGAPVELQARTVRSASPVDLMMDKKTDTMNSIYRPAKTATQSGDWHGHHWRMDWDVLPKGHRWENPLMGWQSSADFMQGTHLNFKSKDDAIQFAEKQGYEFFVQEPNERRFIPKAYANNFVHSPKKLKVIRSK